MPEELTLIEQLTPPVVTFAVIVLIGFIVQIFVNTRLRKIVAKTPWKGDDVIIEGLRGKIILWSVIIGLHAAVPMLHLPDAYHLIVQKILLVLVIFSVTLTVSSIVSNFIKAYSGEPKGEIFSTSIFTIFSKIVVMSIGFLIILQTLDISITPILTALGVGGLAVALALQDTLGNLFAGLNILLSGKIKRGDYIKIQSGEEGYVVDITWRNTTIRQLANNYIIVPNSRLAASITTNYHLPNSDISLTVPLSVAYDSDLDKVEKVTLETARQVLAEIEGGVTQEAPTLSFQNLGDSGIGLSVFIRVTEYSKQYRIRHEFIKRLLKRYKNEGIIIPYPVRTIEFAEGSNLPVRG